MWIFYCASKTIVAYAQSQMPFSNKDADQRAKSSIEFRCNIFTFNDIRKCLRFHIFHGEVNI